MFWAQCTFSIYLKGGVYSSPEEYFDTVLRLWVGMTFCDGNSAINPKCRYKNGDKDCAQVH
jgi:hypothetical protein